MPDARQRAINGLAYYFARATPDQPWTDDHNAEMADIVDNLIEAVKGTA